MKTTNQMLSKAFLLLSFVFPTILFSQNASENVVFTNPDFLKALLAKDSTIDLNGDHLIQKAEAEKVIKINLMSCHLTDAKDIVNFPNLKELILTSNEIQSLIVENFQFLESVSCADNHLTVLIIRNLPRLKDLHCLGNKLSDFDMVNLPKLESLSLSYNRIREIDLSQYPELKYLDLMENKLRSLDISKNINLIQFNISENKIKTIDITQNAKLNLRINYLDENVVVVGTSEQLEKLRPGITLQQGK